MHTRSVALSIAGSDSGGGAGLQADLKTFQRCGAFGTTVVTCLTAQNTTGVAAIHAAPPDFIAAQLTAVFGDFQVKAAKTGMLWSAEIIHAVARELARHPAVPLVVDPVMVATSGDRLLRDEAVAAYREVLLPRAALVTPNLHEAEILSGRSINTVAGMEEAALEIAQLGPAAVLVKGGHLPGHEATDVLLCDGRIEVLRGTPVRTDREFHGSGCTLSAAITAFLAQGKAVPDACREAKAYLARAIAGAMALGSGALVLDHWA